MNSETLSQFKTLLLTQRQELQTRLQSQDANQKSMQQPEIGDNSPDAGTEILEPLAESGGELLKKIDFALQRIASDTYGICTTCKKEIPISRLEAKPSVSLCLGCQKEHEAEA